MSVPDFAQGIQTSFLAAPTHASTPSAPTATDKTDDGFSFDDFLDIINPLQHLPIVSTLYRHFTGDTIKPLEQIAGDALYGGLVGLGSSVADYAFQKATGKDFGDTVLAFLDGDDDSPPTAVADATQTAPAAQTTAATQPQPVVQAAATHAPTPLIGAQMAMATAPGDMSSSALIAAIQRDGISQDLAARALSAYQASMLLPKMADAAVP